MPKLFMQTVKSVTPMDETPYQMEQSQYFDVSLLVEHDEVELTDPMDGASPVPGSYGRRPFTIDELENFASQHARQAAVHHFGGSNLPDMLREPTDAERQHVKITNGRVLFFARKAAHIRAWIAAMSEDDKRQAKADATAKEKRRRAASVSRVRTLEDEIKQKERFLKTSKEDVEEAKRLRELQRTLDTAERYEVDILNARAALEQERRQLG